MKTRVTTSEKILHGAIVAADGRRPCTTPATGIFIASNSASLPCDGHARASA